MKMNKSLGKVKSVDPGSAAQERQADQVPLSRFKRNKTYPYLKL
jgi:hypothetical protein